MKNIYRKHWSWEKTVLEKHSSNFMTSNFLNGNQVYHVSSMCIFALLLHVFFEGFRITMKTRHESLYEGYFLWTNAFYNEKVRDEQCHFSMTWMWKTFYFKFIALHFIDIIIDILVWYCNHYVAASVRMQKMVIK